ncbi:MAG: S8 family serine peptidase [Planctomycetota bacterium]
MEKTKKTNWISLVALFALFVLCPIQSPSQSAGGVTADRSVCDYIVTVGNEELRFVRRPELGYVIVRSEDQGVRVSGDKETDNLVQPVRGLGRRGVSVVFSQRPPGENESTIRELGARRHIKYAAPLFCARGETVAIIPEIVVRLTTGGVAEGEMDAEQLEALCRTMDLTIKKRLEFTDLEYLVEVLGTDENAVFASVQQLNQIPFVEWAVPNVAFRPRFCSQVMPNDTYFPNQWHLNNTGQASGTPDVDIDAPEAWEVSTGDPDIVVAVVDSGVDTDHPDLINNIVPGYDFYDDDNSPEPHGDDAHGMACAGLVAAQGNNGIGVTGVAWDCKVMPVRIADWAEPGLITEADVASAFRWAAVNGADVLTNSWGSSWSLPVVRSAIAAVTAPDGIGRDGKGCVVLAASGNWPSGGPIWYPAKYPEAIAVGATNQNDVVWYYSGSGPELEIVAPSGGAYDWGADFNLWTTDIAGSAGWNKYNGNPNILDYTDQMGGTSGACPIAAGVAALILSVDPNLTNIQVRNILRISAIDLGEPGRDDYYGYGRLEARASLALAQALPESLFVDDNAPDDPGPGDPAVSDPLENGSAEHPFDAIQEAVDFSLSGESVIVLPGTYTGYGNRDIDFGGKAMTLRSTDPNDPNIVEATIIDCNGTEGEPHRGFYFQSGEDSDSVLQGLTITNGYAGQGGGIYCDRSSPTVTNCTFSGNIGGGMYNYISGPTVTNCTFSGNSAVHHGGGLGNYCSGPTLTNCTFSGNSARWGGGMYSYWSNDNYGIPTLTNCVFSGNYADVDGGGVYNYHSEPVITNSTFSRNSSHVNGKGGGMFNHNSSPTLTNCTFSGNLAATGGGIYDHSSSATLTNCILWGNISRDGMGETAQLQTDGQTPAVNYCCIQGLTGALGGAGNISDDPLFVHAGGTDGLLSTEEDNLRLLPGSSCIDAGDNSAVPPLLLTDLDLELRFTDDPATPDTGSGTPPIVDMGAYEGPDQGFLVSAKSVVVPEGQTATFTVALAIDPLGTVEAVVAVEPGDPDITIQSGASLTFDSSNYSQPQRVTIAAAEDEDRLEDATGIRISDGSVLFAGVIAWEIENDVAAVLFVDANANGANDGTSWTDAFTHLQDAMPLATGAPRAVVEIRVAEGIYKPDHGGGVTLGDREATFQLISGVAICGGYAGASEPNVRDIDVYKTVLSGDLNGDDIEVAEPEDLLDEPSRGENSYHVVTGSWTDPDAVLDGFTITAGNANQDFPSSRASGGGMLNDNGSPTLVDCTFSGNAARAFGGGMSNDISSPTLTGCMFNRNWAVYEGGGMYNDNSGATLNNCIFSGNSTGGLGGGMHNDSSRVTMTDCIFSGNSAKNGGGMYNEASSSTMTNCMFSGNSAERFGGGMYNGESDPTLINCAFITNLGSYGGGMFSAACNPKLTNCKFTGNSAVNGGGMFNGQSGPTLTNCIFSGNSTDSEGGGMYNYDDSSPALTNCTFAANSALNGSALACDSYQQRLPSSPQVTNCVLWDGGNEIWNNDNSAITITYSNVQSPPSTESGEGNINADPCFTEPGYWVDKNDPNIIVEPNDPNAVWVDGDYHLWEGSPCINAGDPNYVDDPNETDLAGQPRIIGGRIDMGAFEAVIQTKANLCVLPRVINRRSRQPEIMALIRLPEGITRDQIDDNQPLLLYPGGIEAHLWRTQYFIPSGKAAQRSARILALFDKAELMAAVEDNSEVELQLVGRLRTGWYFYGIDIVEIIDRKDNDGGDG